jgi:drug/metabolite transporter (DMT)-like permease
MARLTAGWAHQAVAGRLGKSEFRNPKSEVRATEMLAAILTTFCFAVSAVCGQRLSRLLGGITANFWRLLLATTILALMTILFWPASVRRETFGWFFLSGMIGFGIGDVGLYLAYPHLGSRLTILVLMCFGCFFSAAGDWLILGTRLNSAQGVSVIVILTGIILALHRPHEPLRFNRGLFFAVVAGWGQGFGAVISRIAQDAAAAEGFSVNGISQAAQRAVGGLLIGGLVYAAVRTAKHQRQVDPAVIDAGSAILPIATPPRRKKHLTFWLVTAALFGPVIGVSCMQWALDVLKSSALVVAITATSPLVIVPLARWIEGDKPSPRALIGTILGVAGVVLAGLARNAR